MTEVEWLTARGPGSMQLFVVDRVSRRKHRLFACACCRMIWERLTDVRSRSAVEAAERYVDGFTTKEDCQRAADEAFEAQLSTGAKELNAQKAVAFAAFDAANLEDGDSAFQTQGSVIYAVAFYAGFPWDAAKQVERQAAKEREECRQADVLRCVVGNPFRPAHFSPDWRTETVIGLAQTMYDEREFGSLPILADALQEAGCEEADILDHCRGPGPHVRGCWVVDLVLGKN